MKMLSYWKQKSKKRALKVKNPQNIWWFRNIFVISLPNNKNYNCYVEYRQVLGILM